MKKILIAVTIVILSFCLTSCKSNDLEEMYIPSQYDIVEVEQKEE